MKSQESRTGYAYARVLPIDEAHSDEEAIRMSVLNYMHHQLGWSIDQCEVRVQDEVSRVIPRKIFDDLTAEGWNLQRSKLLDVGAGQGGAVLEALERKADAFGVEPGEEFLSLARRRLESHDHDPQRITNAPGEHLPFDDESFDYVISLQVLEHVPDAEAVIREMYRVLKPGGRCYVSCENYLSFREQHYRVAWLPLLPKPIGKAYLRLRGRNPSFIEQYVYYTTYPSVMRAVKRAGFRNLTEDRVVGLADHPEQAAKPLSRRILSITRQLPGRRFLIRSLFHSYNFFRAGIWLHLVKPADPVTPGSA